jgi:hypothetical protein
MFSSLLALATGVGLALSSLLFPVGQSPAALVPATLSPAAQPPVAALSGEQFLAEGDSCEVQQAVITWGFKESFRSYLSGAIALGQWTTSGEVSYETPVFIFSTTGGDLAADLSAGEVSFDGELRFRAHGGILDTALANPRLEILGPGEAALFFDVIGETMGGLSVSSEGVDFVRVSWPVRAQSVDSAAGLWSVEGATVVLTPLGSRAFGTYISGEVFDPMSVSMQVTPGCLEQPGMRWWWLPGGVVALAVLGAALGWWITRANRSRAPEHQ